MNVSCFGSRQPPASLTPQLDAAAALCSSPPPSLTPWALFHGCLCGFSVYVLSSQCVVVNAVWCFGELQHTTLRCLEFHTNETQCSISKIFKLSSPLSPHKKVVLIIWNDYLTRNKPQGSHETNLCHALPLKLVRFSILFRLKKNCFVILNYLYMLSKPVLKHILEVWILILSSAQIKPEHL